MSNLKPTPKTYYYLPSKQYFVFSHPSEFIEELKDSKFGWNDHLTLSEYIRDYGDRLEKLYGFKIDSSTLISFVDSLIRINLLVEIDHNASSFHYP